MGGASSSGRSLVQWEAPPCVGTNQHSCCSSGMSPVLVAHIFVPWLLLSSAVLSDLPVVLRDKPSSSGHKDSSVPPTFSPQPDLCPSMWELRPQDRRHSVTQRTNSQKAPENSSKRRALVSWPTGHKTEDLLPAEETSPTFMLRPRTASGCVT